MSSPLTGRWPALVAGLALAAAGALSSCSSGSTNSAGPGAGGSSSALRSQHAAPVGMTHRLAQTVANPTVTHLALGSHYLAYTQAKSAAPQAFPDEVVAMDLSTRRSKVVARTAWPKGQSDWVVTDGDWVFWTDQNIAGADNPDGLRWTIRGADLRTGKKVVVARNTFDSPVPLPVAGAGRVVWAQQAKRGSASNSLREFVIRTGRTKQLAVIPADQIVDQVAIGRSANYFDALSANGRTSDVWRVATAGGAPRRVTSSGTARGVAADPGSDVAAWSNGSPASDPTGFTVAADGRAGRSLRTGVEYGLQVGRGFASYISQSGALQVVRDGTTKPLQLAGNVVIPCRTAVAANDIAYCTQNAADGHITVRVDRIGR